MTILTFLSALSCWHVIKSKNSFCIQMPLSALPTPNPVMTKNRGAGATLQPRFAPARQLLENGTTSSAAANFRNNTKYPWHPVNPVVNN
jgi:hypothetical protein